MRYIVALLVVGIVIAIGLSSDVGDAQPSGVGLAGRCSSDASCAPDGANPRKCSMLGNGVGVCVDTCAAVTCAPGQQADRRGGGCICLEQKGAGQACSADAECGSGRCVQFTATAFSDGKPGGKVCVPATAQTCNPAKSPSCQAPTSCAATDASGNGWCAPAYTTGPTSHVCRFDDVASGASCTRADPFGKACGSCAWAGDARACDPNLHACIPSGICSTEVCGNGFDEDCNGSDLVCPCTPKRWYRDADGDGHGTPNDSTLSCDQPAGYVTNWDDCDDKRANRFPGNPEKCGDGVDNNCDGNCDEGCFNLVYEKALCPTDSSGKKSTNYMLCNDNMLTFDKNEGPEGPATSFITYKSPIPGVTTDKPLLRCYVNGYHFPTMGDNNCSNVEGTFGYPMTSFQPNGRTLVDCYANSTDPHHSGQLELIEWSRSPTPTKCSGTPPHADGPWKRFGDFGYEPPFSGPTPTISSCWGQSP